jgi:hypothetical protein
MPLLIDLGFTGTRVGMTEAQRTTFRRFVRQFYGCFHEGDCIGSDFMAAEIVDDIGGYFFHIHPPISQKWRANYIPKNSDYKMWEEKFFSERDLDIVHESDVMVATPSGMREIRRGSGTWLTIRMARAELKPLALIFPDGTIKYERWKPWLPKL